MVSSRNLLKKIRDRVTGAGTLRQRLEAVEATVLSIGDETRAIRTELGQVASREDIAELSTLTEQRQVLALEKIAELSARTEHVQFSMGQMFDELRAQLRVLAARRAAAWAPVETVASPDSASSPHDGPMVERIAFLVQSLELRNHYAPVWDVLPIGSFDIILHDSAASLDPTEFAAWRCDVRSSGELLGSRTKYRTLVSNHPVESGEQPLITRLAHRNVRFMYAAGKSGWNLSAWNALYDVIMCFGPYHAMNFTHCSSAAIVQMGYPRFDRYFTDEADRRMLAEHYGCDPERETVVWLPTWKELSSVGWFDEEISGLMANYNVVVKLHPFMPDSEPERVERLRSRSFNCILVDATDNLPLYQLADYMLFDYGGPPMAGIYTDKRLVLLDVPGAHQDDLTGEDSPDVSIRKYLLHVTPGVDAIAPLLSDKSVWKQQEKPRRTLRRHYFAPYFGFSASVAAQALLSLDEIVGSRSL